MSAPVIDSLPYPPPPRRPAPAAEVGVVVCTHLWERYDQLLACLDSVAAQNLAPAHVVVVVDGDARVAEALARRGGPERVLALPVNGGLSAARNAGVAQLATEWVAFLDDDAVADPDWLAGLHRACAETGAVGAGGWSEPLWTAARPAWWPDELNWAVGCSYAGLPTTRTAVRNVLGGCCLLQRRLFEVIGGFDVGLGRQASGAGAGEETDFCLRVAAALPGSSFQQEPAAVIRHRIPAARARLPYLLERCSAEGAAKATVLRTVTRARRSTGATAPAAALSSETAYLRRLTGQLAGYLRGGPTGWSQAAVLLLGVIATGAGFARGLVARAPAG